MIIIKYLYRDKLGKWYEDSKVFYNSKKALAFMYKFKGTFINFEWICDDPEDNEYLWTHFKP